MEYVFTLVTFAGLHFLAAASPGPNLILVTSHSVKYSYKAGFMLTLGIVIGTFIWASSAALGLGFIIAKYPTVYFIIQHISALYLIWLGLEMLSDGFRNQYEKIGSAVESPRSNFALVFTGFFVNMTNPKSIVYWTSLFSVILPAQSPTWVFASAILIAVSVSFFWWLSVSLFFSTHKVQSAFISLRRYMDMFMGGAMVFLGVKIVSGR